MQIHAGRPSSLIHLRKNFNDILYYASQKEFLLFHFALFNSSNQKEKEKKDKLLPSHLPPPPGWLSFRECQV